MTFGKCYTSLVWKILMIAGLTCSRVVEGWVSRLQRKCVFDRYQFEKIVIIEYHSIWLYYSSQFGKNKAKSPIGHGDIEAETLADMLAAYKIVKPFEYKTSTALTCFFFVHNLHRFFS